MMSIISIRLCAGCHRVQIVSPLSSTVYSGAGDAVLRVSTINVGSQLLRIELIKAQPLILFKVYSSQFVLLSTVA